MSNIFPKIFHEFDYKLPSDFEGELGEHDLFCAISDKAQILISKRTSEYQQELFWVALKIITSALISGEGGHTANISLIRQSAHFAFEKLTLEEIDKLSSYYGISKSMKEDQTGQFFITDTQGEMLHHTTVEKIIVTAFLLDVEIELERLKIFLQYGVSPQFWYPVFDANDSGEQARIDYLIDSVF